MRSIRFAYISLTVATIILSGAVISRAQSTRTWVSSGGDDGAPCSRTAPCKTFAGAISKTLSGGEISVVNSGAYGPLTINKALTIDGNGSLASILSPTGIAITVVAGANDVVTLKELALDGAGGGTNGIRYTSGKALNVKNTTITGFVNRGIDVNLSDSGQLFTDELFINNCGSGIRTTTSANFIFSVINRTQIVGMSNDGLQIQTGSRATVRDSVMSLNTDTGITVSSTTGNAGLNLENTLLDKNSIGLSQDNPNGTIQISQVMITNNNTGINNVAGSVVSFGNNRINGNAVNGAPTSTPGQL